MNKSADTKTTFKFLDAYLLVRRVQPNALILVAQEKALESWSLALYNMTRVDLKNFTFSPV
jgi:pyruvate-formate lyase